MFSVGFADNLAANFSRELADYIIYIIDVSAGDKIPRKGGPGITQADLLVRLYCLNSSVTSPFAEVYSSVKEILWIFLTAGDKQDRPCSSCWG